MERPALAFSRLFDLEIVVDGEHARHAVGADEGSIFIRLDTHHAFKVYMAVLHNDVDWRYGLNGVGGESRITEEGARNLAPDAIVVERRGQHFNLVIDALHALQVFDPALGFAFDETVAHLAVKSHGTAVDAVAEIVENCKLRNHGKFMVDLAGKPLLKKLVTTLKIGAGEGGGRDGAETEDDSKKYLKTLSHKFSSKREN